MSQSVKFLSSNYLLQTFEVRCELELSSQFKRNEVGFETPFLRGLSFRVCLTTSAVNQPSSHHHREQMYGYNYSNGRSKETSVSDGSNKIEISSICEDKLNVSGRAMCVLQKMRIKKDPGYQGNVECSDCLSFDLQKGKKVHIGNIENLTPYIEDGKMYVFLRIIIGDEYHLEQKATAIKLYNSFLSPYADFEIKTSDGSLKVFRSILCLKWPYFETMMDAKYMESSSKVWTINDISLKTMKDIVIYVYCDAITFKDTQQVIEILKAAHRYQLQQLVRACAKYLLWEIEFKDALEVIVLSDLYRLHELKVKCCNLISKALVQTDMKDLPGYVVR